MLKTYIMVSAATVDRYFPGLMAVVFANKEPELAMEDCRNNNAIAVATTSITSTMTNNVSPELTTNSATATQ
jgi:hypothetical protein